MHQVGLTPWYHVNQAWWYTCNSSTQKTEIGESEVQGTLQPQPPSKASLSTHKHSIHPYNHIPRCKQDTEKLFGDYTEFLSHIGLSQRTELDFILSYEQLKEGGFLHQEFHSISSPYPTDDIRTESVPTDLILTFNINYVQAPRCSVRAEAAPAQTMLSFWVTMPNYL